MLEPAPKQVSEPLRICASADLAERGKAVLFDVRQYREPARAFALRFDGQVVAYLNRCVHVPTEMDWQEGEFLDGDREFILCSIHGAAYDPRDGRCAGGPCGRGALTTLRVEERDGEVYWYPSRDTRPPLAISATSARSATLGPDGSVADAALLPEPLPVPATNSVFIPIAVQTPEPAPLPPSESSE